MFPVILKNRNQLGCLIKRYVAIRIFFICKDHRKEALLNGDGLKIRSDTYFFC